MRLQSRYVMLRASSPVHQHEDDTWWFWDETWADEYGPYDIQEQANQMLSRYVDEILNGNRPPVSEYRAC